ncbi:MAG: hypothetical protein OXG42_07810 [Chloroflexi bacterium]|nr:hypothetical protein [Chloroflexota bacterium]
MPSADSTDWELLAERISARYRGRDSLIRGVGVVGDYARNHGWDASLLQILLFRHREEAMFDDGAIIEENGISVTVDSITSGYLVEFEELLHEEPMAGQLADMRTLRMADRTLRDVLASFRDRYYSADGRQARAGHALQRARVSLDDCEASGRPFHGVDAVRRGIFPAASAIVGEPVDLLRMPRRMRAAGRVLKVGDLWPRVRDALRLSEIDTASSWSSVDALYGLCRSHLDARMPEVGAALVPRLERALAPARIASDSLMSVDAAAGAAWTSIAAASEIDAIIGAVSAGRRERDDYAQRAAAAYGEPNIRELRVLRAELQRKVG